MRNRLADASGAVIRPFFRQRIEVVHKPGQRAFDPVTEADKGGERAIRAIIERDRPDDGILGEEYGEKPGRNGLRWVLDPVDGTRAFITGRHEWGSLIALEDKEVPVLGILDQPVLGERYPGRQWPRRASGGRKAHAAESARMRRAQTTRSSAPPIPRPISRRDQQAAFARVRLKRA